MTRITAEEAAGLVRAGMWPDYAPTFSRPDVFDAALAERRNELILSRWRWIEELDPGYKLSHHRVLKVSEPRWLTAKTVAARQKGKLHVYPSSLTSLSRLIAT
jgi:hypothetical protein